MLTNTWNENRTPCHADGKEYAWTRTSHRIAKIELGAAEDAYTTLANQPRPYFVQTQNTIRILDGDELPPVSEDGMEAHLQALRMASPISALDKPATPSTKCINRPHLLFREEGDEPEPINVEEADDPDLEGRRSLKEFLEGRFREDDSDTRSDTTMVSPQFPEP